MNLITKLLMENKTHISASGYVSASTGKAFNYITVDIEMPEALDFGLTKKDLLSEVPEKIYVSVLEWELLNYWKDIGVEEIYKNRNNDDIVLCGLEDQYRQPSSMYQIFRFLEHGERHILKDLINHCALIEG